MNEEKNAPRDSVEEKILKPEKKGKKKKNLPLLIIGIVVVLVLIVVTVVSLWPKGVKDTIGPELQLTSPTSLKWYSTNQEKITIQGLVVDESGMKNITWKSDKDSTGTTTVSDDSFEIKDIALRAGDNKITITATDNKGNTSQVVLNISYNPHFLFYDTTLSQDYLFKDDSQAQITVRSGVEVSQEVTLGSVYLYRVDKGEPQKLTKLQDNGDINNGDDIPRDGVFSTIEWLSTTSDDPVLLRIGANRKGFNTVYYSGIMDIKSLTKLTSDEFNHILTTNSDLSTKFEEFKTSKSEKEAAKEMSKYLTERDDIELAGTSKNGYGVWWKYKDSGILTGLLNNPEGTRGDKRKKEELEADRKKQKENAVEDGVVMGAFDVLTYPVSFSAPVRAAEAEGNELEVKSTKAIYLGPYLHDFGVTDDYHDAWKTIKESKCPKCQLTERKDAEVTVEDFKTLSNYGLIIIVSHGDTWFDGVFGDNRGQVITWTYQQVSRWDYLTYLPDLLMGRLAIDASDGTLAVLPSYISAYNGTFPDSLVYVGTCRSTYNFSMASAYLGKGAKAFYGFSEYVDSAYAKDVAGVMFEHFLDKDENTQKSFTEATNTKGIKDNNNPPAWFDFWGRSDLEMGGKKIQNLGFEDGLLGWQTEGDARVLSSLASLKPQEKKKMAIISTGLGSVSESNSSLSQNTCSKEGTAILSFDYNVVSEEPMEYFQSAYDDNFTMNVYVKGKKTTLVERTINNSSWNAVSGINFAGGDDTTFMTGWTHVSENIGKIEPDDSIKIEFRVSDKGDSIYDTATLIDNVMLKIE